MDKKKLQVLMRRIYKRMDKCAGIKIIIVFETKDGNIEIMFGDKGEPLE